MWGRDLNNGGGSSPPTPRQIRPWPTGKKNNVVLLAQYGETGGGRCYKISSALNLPYSLTPPLQACALFTTYRLRVSETIAGRKNKVSDSLG